jgi:peroxiredoxin
MQQAYDQYRADGFVILAVNMLEGSAQIADFVTKGGLTFPVLVDTGGVVSELYQVKSIPTTYLLDREGVIQDVIIGGPIPRAMIESKVKALLVLGGGE